MPIAGASSGTKSNGGEVKEISQGVKAIQGSAALVLGLLVLTASLTSPLPGRAEGKEPPFYHLSNLDDSPHLMGFAKFEDSCETDFFALFMRADASVAHLNGRQAQLEIEIGADLYGFDSDILAHPQPGEEGSPTLAFLGHAMDPDFFPLAAKTPEITVRITGPESLLQVLLDRENRFSTKGLTANRIVAEIACRPVDEEVST